MADTNIGFHLDSENSSSEGSRVFISDEIIAFDDTTAITLGGATGANIAEIQIQGGNAIWRIGDVTAFGYLVGNGQKLEFESSDEIDTLEIIGQGGQVGNIVVSYYNVQNLNN